MNANVGELFSEAKENFVFLLTAIVIAAVVLLIGTLFEKKLHSVRKVTKTKYITLTAISAALAGVLMLIELPLFFAPPFYKLDFSELPVLICSFYLGPVAGILCELIKVVVKLLLKGTSSAFVGDFANFIIGCFFVVPATLLYHVRKTRKTAAVGLAIGMVSMTLFGSIFNYFYLVPKFAQLYGIPLDAIISMGHALNGSIQSLKTLIVLAVVPFNLVKGFLDGVLCFLLYKKTEKLLFR